MERFSSENNSIKALGKVFRSRFFYFLLGFVFLIIAANNYSKPAKQNKKMQVASLIEPPVREVTEKAPGNERDKLVELAVDQLGVEYTYAGKKPSTGFDCSGFTSFVYDQLGIEIPPSSITQSRFGEKVNLNEAEKGDLIFFKSPSAGNHIGHVGIIISNNDNNISFIHSSSSRGVVIDNLQSEHYKRRFRAIRRVL